MSRLAKRGREEETSVPQEYLQQIHDRHEEWFMEPHTDLPACVQGKPVLVIDCSGDLINSSQLRLDTLDQVCKFVAQISSNTTNGA